MNIKVHLSCFKCDKPSVVCKGMCSSCYFKMYRNTEKGKEVIRTNIERRKNEMPYKPPKPPKQNCECGNPSVAKNLCSRCYQKINKYKRNAVIGDKLFNTALVYVKKGYNISNACKKLGFSRAYLYQQISPIQKAELIRWKKIADFDYYES